VSLLDAITEAVAATDETNGAVVVTGFVVVASFMDDGGRSIFSDTLDEQRCHETLGLLAFATAMENHRVIHPEDGG
jgi:hypothetical protein